MNLVLIFLYQLTNRRNFFPILSLFFLSIPDTRVQQIGVFTAAGWLLSFILEIPSGYFADTFGHKRTLILAKVMMIVSTVFYLIADSFSDFFIATLLLSASMAFNSGTLVAYVHEYIESQGRKDFARVLARLNAYVSLLSIIFILGYPILFTQDPLLPFKIALLLDLMGLLAAFLFFDVKERYRVRQRLMSVAFDLSKTNFYPLAIFTVLVWAVLLVFAHFREPFLVEIGVPVVLIGSAMALSRLAWFATGFFVPLLERVKLKTLLFCELLLFPGHLLLVALVQDPIVSTFVLALMLGYFYGRSPIIQDHLIRRTPNKRYKATALSIRQQLSNIAQVPLALIAGAAMGVSYSTGLFVLASILFVGMLIAFPFIKYDLRLGNPQKS